MNRQPNRILALAVLAALALALISGATVQAQDQAEVALKAAMDKEVVDGNLPAAIEQYRNIVKSYSAHRVIAAQALVRIGQCYERLGRQEARQAYEQVLREYADQPEPVRVARERIAALQPGGTNGAREMRTRRVWGGPGADPTGTPSPDGRYLSYTDWSTGDLALRDLTTGQNRRLTNKGSWSSSPMEEADQSMFSRDSKQIAYTWCNKDNFFELRVVGLDGSAPRVLYGNKERQVQYPAPADWSPDGKQILADFIKKDKTRQTVLVSVADGSVRPLKVPSLAGPGRMLFSPDGRYVAHDVIGKASGESDIFLFELASGRDTPAVERPGYDSLVDWTPDGKGLLLISDRTRTHDLWLVSVADGKPQGPPELIKKNVGPSFSLGITRAGAYYYAVYGTTREIYATTLSVETGKFLAAPEPVAQRFVGSSWAPAWSPDGKSLAYLSERGTGTAASTVLVIRSTESGEERELKLKLKLKRLSYSLLRWAPDGRALLIGGNEKQGAGLGAVLYRVDLETGEATAVAPLPWGAVVMARFDPSPDGKTIFHVGSDPADTRHNGALLARNLQTGRDTELVRRWWLNNPAVSPDGQRLVFLTVDEDGQWRNVYLMMVSATGGPPQELARFDATGNGLWPTPVWTSDGRHVIFVKDLGRYPAYRSDLWMVPANGGAPQSLGLTINGRMTYLALHPDNRQLVFGTWENKPEVWVLENFLPAAKRSK